MSNEPSDAQKLIAEVHRAHWPQRRHNDVDLWTECRCGAGKFYNPADHSKHFAAEVDKALGGLTREWATEFDSWYRNLRGEKRDYVEHFDYKGDEHSARDHVRTSKGVRLVTRFVSGWTVTE